MKQYTEEYRLLRDAVSDLRDGVASEEGQVRTQEAVIDRLDLILGRFPKLEAPKWEPPKMAVKKYTNGPQEMHALEYETTEDSLRDELSPRVAARQRVYSHLMDPRISKEYPIKSSWRTERPFRPMGVLFWGVDGETILQEVRIGWVDELLQPVPAEIYKCGTSFERVLEWAKNNLLQFERALTLSSIPQGGMIEVVTLGRVSRVAVWGLELQ